MIALGLNRIEIIPTGDLLTFDLVDVNVGRSTVTDIIHRDGFFIEMDELEDDYLEIVIESNHPITEAAHVTKIIHSTLLAVSEDHYNHHIAYHRIIESQGMIFNEKPLYSTNIENGLGLFSTCVRKKGMLDLR